MKPNNHTNNDLLSRFDKELKAILLHDLKMFKANRGKFLNQENQAVQNLKNRMVA